MIVSTTSPNRIPLRRRLGRIARLGDDSFDGDGYGPTVNYGDVTGGYSNQASDNPIPDYSSIDNSGDSGYDPNLQAQAEDIGFTLTAQGTDVATPSSNQSSPASTLINWGDDLSSFMNGILGPPILSTSPIVGASGASSHPTTTPPKSTPAKSLPANLPKVSPTKPPKSNNLPDVNAYERLFATNLANFMASNKTDADKVAGENYFVQEWSIFSGDMGSAGSWGSSGLAQRNRGGSLDWWARYYDPIANSNTSGVGVSSGLSSLFSGGNSGLLWLVLAGVVVWYMTE